MAKNLRLLLESEREQNAKNEDLVRVLGLDVASTWISNCVFFKLFCSLGELNSAFSRVVTKVRGEARGVKPVSVHS